MDITERKQAEEALRASEKKYRLLVKNITSVVYKGYKDWSVEFFDKKIELIVGYTTDDFNSKRMKWNDIIVEEDIETAREIFIKALKTDKSYVREYRINSKAGDIQWIQERGYIVCDNKGKIDSVSGVFFNITERKRTEEALKESEEKYRTLLETTYEGCWLINPERKAIEVNQALCNMLGYRQDEMIGKTPFDFVDDENRKIFIEQTSTISTTHHRSYEITLKKKNGQDLHTYFNATTLRDKSEAVQGSFAFVTDITERKQAQEERNRLAVAIEQAEESVFITDRHGTIQYVNPAFEHATGYSRKDAIGQNPRILKSGKHDALFYAEMWDTLTRGHAWKGHFINKKKDGSLYEADATISPVLDKSGKITNFVSIKRDVTHAIELEKRLVQAQKMESIGILAGGIAHDFNNLLTIIIGNIELAEDDIKPEVGASECLEEAAKACIQAQTLTRQLITFAKGGAPVKKIGSIGDMVTETTNLTISKSNVKCDFLISHDLWPVEFDEGQMKHAVKNMIDNAVESMPDEGTIHVKAENITIIAKKSLPFLEGKYVKISIRDHGVGIPEEHLLQIFDPYFSTKEMGVQKGMGLGLATTYSIIKRHDGYITVESEVGVGTTFTLLLPAHEKDIRELKPIEILEPEKPSIRTGRILLMDDEEGVRKVSKKRLSVLGYESELAKDGAQAIELYKKAMDSGQPFDAVILDLTVEVGMGGKEAIKFLQKINPQVKAIVSSGYSNDPVMTNFRAYGFTGALPKPNTNKELFDVLKR